MRVWTWSALVTAAAAACVTAASAQQPAGYGCTSTPSAAGTQTIRCASVTIVAESGAKFTLLDRDKNGQIDAVDLASKAVLVEAAKQKKGRTFEVITPQAIAAVRGTQWAVDAEGTKTSVFVQIGIVGVQRRPAPGRVDLGPGQGVDVDASAAPLDVRYWPEPRVTALLARLGR